MKGEGEEAFIAGCGEELHGVLENSACRFKSKRDHNAGKNKKKRGVFQQKGGSTQRRKKQSSYGGKK